MGWRHHAAAALVMYAQQCQRLPAKKIDNDKVTLTTIINFHNTHMCAQQPATHICA